jgi:hypothetical protein
VAGQTREQQRYLFFDFGECQLGGSIVCIVDMPVFYAIYPGREPALEQGPVLGLLEGDDEICASEVEFQYLQREAPGSRAEDAPCLEPGQGMGGDGAGIVQT